VEPGVEVEARAVLEEDVRVAGAGDDLLEEVPRDVVGRQTTRPFRVQVRPYSFSRPKIRRSSGLPPGFPIGPHAA